VEKKFQRNFEIWMVNGLFVLQHPTQVSRLLVEQDQDDWLSLEPVNNRTKLLYIIIRDGLLFLTSLTFFRGEGSYNFCLECLGGCLKRGVKLISTALNENVY
jgi:hypothetical protein